MQLGWIDFSKEDRQKALDVINLLSEQGAVDELGIGIVRDAFANYFFPGTSSINSLSQDIWNNKEILCPPILDAPSIITTPSSERNMRTTFSVSLSFCG